MRNSSREFARASRRRSSRVSYVRNQQPRPPIPVWLGALLSAPCQAIGNGESRTVRWDCSSGKAVYTNAGTRSERIEPLGVVLEAGHALAVHWPPGESEYSLEVFRQYDQCA